MTIIKSSIYLKNHEHEALDTDVTEAFNVASGGERIPITLECFCQITRQTISYIKLSHPDFKAIAYGYIGALLSGDLINLNESTTTRIVSLFMMKASAHGNQLNLEAIPDIKEECLRIWKEESKKLDSVKVKFWSGWLLEAKKNSAHLNLQGVHKIYGHTFTNEIYESLQRHALKYMTVNVTNLNRMFVFMVKNHKSWPASTFSDPLRIEAFFNALLKETFIKAHNTGKNLHSTAKAWNAFTVNIESALIDSSIWARPFSDILPRVRTPTIKGEKTNITETKKGVLVKQKLITDIPLALTDEEAILLLFNDIEADIKLVVDWATAEANDLWDRCQRRKELAKKGRVVGLVPRFIDNDYLLACICTTFETNGYSLQFGTKYTFRIPPPVLAHTLGLPKSDALDPYKFLLVSQHHEITTAFLSELNLYDEHGNLSGFIKAGGTYQLVGYKDRRGPSLSELKITLNDRTVELVKQIIEITKPVRSYLKKNGDDLWRKLFISCGRGFSPPVITRYPAYNQTTIPSPRVQSILAAMKPHTSKNQAELEKYLTRLSLGSLRASCGVQVYLETMSVEKMSKALGHLRYNPELLAHYLPAPILEFFQSRWIRIFQKALICEAMKDSEYILEATQFSSIKELHIFLTNHALKDIPTHMEEPEKLNENKPIKKESRVYFSVSKGILTALLSLEKAVDNSTEPHRVNGYAKYWSRISSLITNEIESGYDQKLKSHLFEAKKHINHEAMEALIYGPAC